MNILLPVDSRVADTQGFIVVNSEDESLHGIESIESLEFVRKGFRGGCIVGRRLYVCNSFSLKIYKITGNNLRDLSIDLQKQVQLPEWLVGRGANADLHMLSFNYTCRELLLANSYMDCIDFLNLDGQFLRRIFLWELSENINDLVRLRDPKAADLCHLNHIERVGDEILLTLGNLNASGMGQVINMSKGNVILDGLHRPHDGVHYDNQYVITETSKNRILVYDDITSASDLRSRKSRSVNLLEAYEDLPDSRFWPRGVLINDEFIFVGCSQFQDRTEKVTDLGSSQIVVIDRLTLKIVKRLEIPTLGNLEKPVLYSLINLDSVLIREEPKKAKIIEFIKNFLTK